MLALQISPVTQATEPQDLDYVYLPCWAGGNGSGTKTKIELIDRKNGSVSILPIISKYPLLHSEIKEAIARATGKTHWDYRWQAVSCADYEF